MRPYFILGVVLLCIGNIAQASSITATAWIAPIANSYAKYGDLSGDAYAYDDFKHSHSEASYDDQVTILGGSGSGFLRVTFWSYATGYDGGFLSGFIRFGNTGAGVYDHLHLETVGYTPFTFGTPIPTYGTFSVRADTEFLCNGIPCGGPSTPGFTAYDEGGIRITKIEVLNSSMQPIPDYQYLSDSAAAYPFLLGTSAIQTLEISLAAIPIPEPRTGIAIAAVLLIFLTRRRDR